MYKDAPIILFSEKNHDPQFDDEITNLTRKKIDDKFFEVNWEDVESLGQCLLIFDDIDSISPAKLKNAVYNLLNKALKLGRSYKVSVFVSSHSSCSGNETKAMLNESDYLVFFPSTYNRNVKYLCDNYLGLNKYQIDKIRKNKSRWCCIKKTYPNVCIQEHNAFSLSSE